MLPATIIQQALESGSIERHHYSYLVSLMVSGVPVDRSQLNQVFNQVKLGKIQFSD